MPQGRAWFPDASLALLPRDGPSSPARRGPGLLSWLSLPAGQSSGREMAARSLRAAPLQAVRALLLRFCPHRPEGQAVVLCFHGEN